MAVAALQSGPPGLRKAAILLVLLGEDTASEIYRNLPDGDVERLTQEIAEMEYVDPNTALDVLEEYHRLSITQDYLAQGGTDYAKKLLVKAFGEDGARQLLAQVTVAAEASASKLDSLQKADPQQLAKFLEAEHPQTIALILAHLDAKQASGLLMKFPEALRAESIRRLAQLRQFSPEIAQKVSQALHKRLEALGEQHRRAYAGVQGVADLLNRLDPVTTKVILETIEKDDPKLALGIRNLMFTFQDLIGVPEAGIRELLGQLDKKTLSTALRGASEDLKNYIFKSMSSRAVEMLKEDMEVLGPLKARDVIKAQQEAVAVARKLESEGKISLGAETEDEYVV
ncbi:MAG TPA: flagellar motor switch protein FliG [Terriglobales bacterium]|nr:flagellar motor switch protein FliG [Terriglobales bacterium]